MVKYKYANQNSSYIFTSEIRKIGITRIFRTIQMFLPLQKRTRKKQPQRKHTYLITVKQKKTNALHQFFRKKSSKFGTLHMSKWKVFIQWKKITKIGY